MIRSDNDRDPAKWIERVRHAEEIVRHHLYDLEQAIERRHGPYYRETGQREEVELENHAHEWHSLMGPQMTASAPRVRVTTSRVGAIRDGAVALQYALNRWVRATKMGKLNERLAEDYGERWFVVHVAPGSESHGPLDMKGTPVATRLSPRNFFWDPDALELEQCRFMGHKIRRARHDLLDEAKNHPERGWDVEAVRSLIESGKDEHRVQDYDAPTPEYDDVEYYEIWAPEGGDKEGWLYTVGIGQGAETDAARFLRKERRFFGPRTGPYVMCGAYVVMDEIAPLAPLVVDRVQAEEVNSHAKAISRSMSDYKKVVFVEEGDPDLETKITETEHHGVYTVALDDIRQKVIELEIGGLTQVMLAQKQVASDQLDRVSGLFEAIRGNVEGVGTATEVVKASEASNHRTGKHKVKFRTGILETLEKVAWYMVVDPDVELYLGAEANDQFVALETGEAGEAVWVGGDEASDFDAYEFELELYSMDRTDERASEMGVLTLSELSQVDAPAMLQSPFLDWEEILRIKGEVRGIPELPRLVDFEQMRALAALMIGQQGGLPEPQGSTTPQPRLGGTTFGADLASPGIRRQAGNKREASSRMLSRGNGSSAGLPTMNGAGAAGAGS